MATLSLVLEILSVIHKLVEINHQVVGNKHKCASLSGRIFRTVPCFEEIQNNNKIYNKSADILSLFLSFLQEICDFIDKFRNKNYFLKAWNRNSDLETFSEFNLGLTVRIQELDLGISIDIQAQLAKDRNDQNADMEFLKSTVEGILREQGKNHHEIKLIINDLIEFESRNVKHITSAIVDVHRDVQHGNQLILQQLNDIQHDIKKTNLPTLKTINRAQLDFDINDPLNYLGEGGFGKVYKGDYLQYQVAIKFISSDDQNTAKSTQRELEKEALTMQIADFPGIILILFCIFF
jgi:hypothetical protein